MWPILKWDKMMQKNKYMELDTNPCAPHKQRPKVRKKK
jgi:hypothetical protein